MTVTVTQVQTASTLLLGGGLLSWLRLHLLLRHTAGLYLTSGSLPLLRLGSEGEHALVFPELEYQHSKAASSGAILQSAGIPRTG